MRFVCRSIEIYLLIISCVCLWGEAQAEARPALGDETSPSFLAQVTPDNTVDTTVNQNGNVAEITGGQTRGDNLFHSFQDFSVPTGNEAHFNNADTIENIFSRVTGGNISNIDGLIQAQGSASLFLVNPAGIIFGENASLNIGGSFIGSSADSILFPDDISFSASDTQAEPILTVNAPIGLGFRDNPGDIVNRSVADNFTGLTVPASETIALVGGNIEFDAGFVTTPGGRIEIGSVAQNSTVNMSAKETGWNFDYENATDFQNISFTNAFAVSFGANTGDVEVVGRNIGLNEGSQIGINSTAGQAGSLSLIASETLNIRDGSAFSEIAGESSGEDSRIFVQTPRLSLINGGTMTVINSNSSNLGADISVTASEIYLDGTTLNTDIPKATGIFAQTFETATGNGGAIDIDTAKLTITRGAQINSETFGSGNAGNISIDASELIELTGTNSDSNIPSGLFANTRPRQTDSFVTGNGGDISINTSRLIVKDGSQIASTSFSEGDGGNVTINAFESILLSGIASTAELNFRRTGITVSTAPFADSELNEIIFTASNPGNINVTTKDLIIERGAIISANTFSLGNGGNGMIDVERLVISDGGQIRAGSFSIENFRNNELGKGGNLDITAKDSVFITGTGDINGEPVTSGISTIAEGTGGAGSLTLTAGDLSISNEGEINASATGSGSAGNLKIEAQTASLERGSIRATTLAGNGGNISLGIADNLTLRDESQISAAASGDANGGNININSDFIIAFPSQPNGSDIIAQADRGSGGNIEIFAESLLGIDRDERIPGNENNDIDASSEFGLDGSVTIRLLDIEPTGELIELPENVTDSVQTTAQACQSSLSSEANALVLTGKGGTVRPDEPLISTAILPKEHKNEASQRSESTEIQSIQTNRGKIVPARGATVTKDGQVILTSHSTGNPIKNYSASQNCD